MGRRVSDFRVERDRSAWLCEERTAGLDGNEWSCAEQHQHGCRAVCNQYALSCAEQGFVVDTKAFADEELCAALGRCGLSCAERRQYDCRGERSQCVLSCVARHGNECRDRSPERLPFESFQKLLRRRLRLCSFSTLYSP